VEVRVKRACNIGFTFGRLGPKPTGAQLLSVRVLSLRFPCAIGHLGMEGQAKQQPSIRTAWAFLKRNSADDLGRAEFSVFR